MPCCVLNCKTLDILCRKWNQMLAVPTITDSWHNYYSLNNSRYWYVTFIENVQWVIFIFNKKSSVMKCRESVTIHVQKCTLSGNHKARTGSKLKWFKRLSLYLHDSICVLWQNQDDSSSEDHTYIEKFMAIHSIAIETFHSRPDVGAWCYHG